MRIVHLVTAAAVLSLALPAAAQENGGDGADRPDLIVAIAVDQLSADLFDQYRRHFTGGLARLQEGAVFPAGYQGHAATETCPGHATILTGAHPGRAGIIANTWIDLDAARDDKKIYCAEDEAVVGSTSRDYTPSARHLLVPTLGERLKRAMPGSRNVAVAGKDRAALMMGGRDTDAIWFWGGEGFITIPGRETSGEMAVFNADAAKRARASQQALSVPAFCEPSDRAVSIGGGGTVGTYRFGRDTGDDIGYFRATPQFDEATLKLALAMVDRHRLGQRGVTDTLSVGLSATDYIGHVFGTNGVEMCINLNELDRNMGQFFNELDRRKVDYVVALTADHGGHDLPERLREQGVPTAARVDAALNDAALNTGIARELRLPDDEQRVFSDGPFGDFYISRTIDDAQKTAVRAAAIRQLSAHPQVEAVVDRDTLLAMPMPTAAPEEWTLEERARASFHPDRSGDFIVMLKKAITPIADPSRGYVATHGSPWDYDRRVPILFWRAGMTPFEQPVTVQTVDIAPTLAALVGLPIAAAEMDGRCLDIDAGATDSCD